jgi:hypothetical protein
MESGDDLSNLYQKRHALRIAAIFHQPGIDLATRKRSFSLVNSALAKLRFLNDRRMDRS